MTETKVTRATGLGDPLVRYRQNAHRDGRWTYRHAVSLTEPVDRNRWLIEVLLPGARVLHVGCATEGETRMQFEQGRLLFAQIEAVAAAQLGVDPAGDAMAELEDIVHPQHPLQICRLEDVPRDVILAFRPDVVLLGEVLEHIPDAGTMLAAARDAAQLVNAEIVITVPNALSFAAISSWLDGVESVHPDHVNAYTPRTLQTLLEKCELDPIEIIPSFWGSPPRPLTLRNGASILRHTRGSVRHRLRRVLEASLVHRYPDGWIARARAASS